LFAATVAAGFMALPIGAAYADEVSDLKAEAKALRQQNDALAKRLAAIEKRQKALEADTTQPTDPTQRIMNAHAADLPLATKAPPGSVDDSLCWHRVCLYGVIDAGFGYEAHGAPFNGSAGQGVLYGISKASNNPMWAASPNGLSQSNIGLKGATEILPGLDAVFKLESGFNPYSGQLVNGPASLVQNNGVPLGQQTASFDSSRAGQAFNNQALVGLSSATYGTLTFGRQYALTNEQIVAYDPLGASYAFSLLGFSSAFGGGGLSEDARLDQSIKYRWEYGPVHAGALYQIGSYGGTTWDHDAYEGDLGFTYQGFSVDGTYSQFNGAVSLGLLGTSPFTPVVPANVGNQTLAATVTDDTTFMITAKYKWDRFEVLGGYEHMQFANPANPATAGFVDEGYVASVVTNGLGAGTKDKILQLGWIGGKWQATDQLTLIAAYYHETQNAYDTTVTFSGCSTAISSHCSGTADYASVVFDYVLSKHFDVYAGVMHSQVAGGLSNGFFLQDGGVAHPTTNVVPSNWDPTVGMRYAF
jgi:predicted porin